jgi:hypothetical protein
VERRRFARFELDDNRTELRRKSLLPIIGAGPNLAHETLNLSEGGARLRTSDRVPPGTRVRVKIQLDRTRDAIEAIAEVRWTYQSARDGSVFYTGVEFAGEETDRTKKIAVMREWYSSPQYKAMKDSRLRKKESDLVFPK